MPWRRWHASELRRCTRRGHRSAISAACCACELFGIGGGNSRSGSLQCLPLEMQTSALSKLGQRTQAPPISWLMRLALDHPHLISLAAGFTDNPSLPVEETRALLNEILGSPRSRRAALQYGTTAGDPDLRRFTAAPLRKQGFAG